MTDKYRDVILELINKHGALGVNAIQRETDIPLSTLHKYLHNQNYFRQNTAKKWDLPENVQSEIKADTVSLYVNQLETSIQILRTQLDDIVHSATNLLVPAESIKKAIAHIQHPVANSSDVGNKRLPTKWRDIIEKIEELPKVIKSKKNTTTTEYYDLLRNVDWYELIIEMGLSYFRDVLSTEIYDVLLGQSSELSDDALENLKEYQIGQPELTVITDNSDM